MVKLYARKESCCGCAACMNACPEGAITMEADEYGFLYPKVNEGLCKECGLCKSVCAFQNSEEAGSEPLAAYVAVNNDCTALSKSSSGGIFAALASLVLAQKGVVFGCAWNSRIEPLHLCIDNPGDIERLQGSKYVQSSINNAYAEAKKYLDKGRKVLFTGTPCQIAGLNAFLKKKYNNLITADLICHGVPGAAFFKGYIEYLEVKLKGEVIDFKFRDKSKGWGYTGKVLYRKNGLIKEKSISQFTSYYYNYFLKGDIFRDSCYKCKYAGSSRQGDFSMGDYWGIENIHPEVDKNNGVSALIVNSKKGISLIEALEKYLTIRGSTYENVKAYNDRLIKPMVLGDRREKILNTWLEGGYRAVAGEFQRKYFVANSIKRVLPEPVKNFIKKLLRQI